MAERFHVAGTGRGRRALNEDVATLLQRGSYRHAKRGEEKDQVTRIQIWAQNPLLRGRYHKTINEKRWRVRLGREGSVYRLIEGTEDRGGGVVGMLWGS